MLFATTAYVVCLVGIILMYIWYAPKPSCLLNIFFISWTLVLLQLMTSVSLHPKVRFSELNSLHHARYDVDFLTISAIGWCWHFNSRAYGTLCCLPLLVRH